MRICFHVASIVGIPRKCQVDMGIPSQSPYPWHLPIVNHHEAKFIMNQTSIDHEAYE